MRKPLIYAGFLSVLAISVFEKAHANELIKHECVATSYDRYKPDDCKRTFVKGSCSIDAMLPKSVQIDIKGKIYKGVITSQYQCCEPSRYEVTFGGLVRGMLELRNQKEKAAAEPPTPTPTSAEIYENHDASGKTYTKYTCYLRSRTQNQ